MQLHLSPERSYYEASTPEVHSFQAWLAAMVFAIDPVDETGKLAHMGVHDDSSWRHQPSGRSYGYFTREPYNSHFPQEEVEAAGLIGYDDQIKTNVVIEDGEIWETAASFVLSNPSEVNSYFPMHNLTVQQHEPAGDKYQGNITIMYIPSHPLNSKDILRVIRNIQPEWPGGGTYDWTTYKIDTGTCQIDITNTCHPFDIERGEMIPKPVNEAFMMNGSLIGLAKDVSRVLGIKPPDVEVTL